MPKSLVTSWLGLAKNGKRGAVTQNLLWGSARQIGEIVSSWTKSYTGQAADRTEVLSVSRAKRKTGLHSCGCDQSIGELNAVCESMLFDEGGGCGTDGFGKRKDSELKLAERLPDQARLRL